MQRIRSRPKVLVVDDEQEVLRSVHDLLRIDYQVITCQSGQEAVEYLKAAPDVAVILSDQRMPGMSGVEVLQQAQSLRPETTRLLFTAYADIHAVIDAINQGHVFRYITKPWEPEELESIIRQAVERHELIMERDRLLTELQAANARLAETDRLKGAFLEVASHELNTPVTVVLGLTELWKQSLGSEQRPPNGSGSNGSAPRPSVWPEPSTGCSSSWRTRSSARRSISRAWIWSRSSDRPWTSWPPTWRPASSGSRSGSSRS